MLFHGSGVLLMPILGVERIESLHILMPFSIFKVLFLLQISIPFNSLSINNAFVNFPGPLHQFFFDIPFPVILDRFNYLQAENDL